MNAPTPIKPAEPTYEAGGALRLSLLGSLRWLLMRIGREITRA